MLSKPRLLIRYSLTTGNFFLSRNRPHKPFCLQLQTATVYSGKNGIKVTTGFIYRISQTAFLDNKSAFLSHLTDRIADISDLSLNSSEMWQVINYSPGGFYRVHSDYLDNVRTSLDSRLHFDVMMTFFLFQNLEDVQKYGNRITSMLFYVSGSRSICK